MIKQSAEIYEHALSGIFKSTASVSHCYDNKAAKAEPTTDAGYLVIWLKACTGYFFHTKLLMVSFLSGDDKSIGANEQTLLEESESWDRKPSWSGTQSSVHWKLCQNLDLQ